MYVLEKFKIKAYCFHFMNWTSQQINKDYDKISTIILTSGFRLNILKLILINQNYIHRAWSKFIWLFWKIKLNFKVKFANIDIFKNKIFQKVRVRSVKICWELMLSSLHILIFIKPTFKSIDGLGYQSLPGILTW